MMVVDLLLHEDVRGVELLEPVSLVVKVLLKEAVVVMVHLGSDTTHT